MSEKYQKELDELFGRMAAIPVQELSCDAIDTHVHSFRAVLELHVAREQAKLREYYDPDTVRKAVCHVYGVQGWEFMSSSREARLVAPRRLFCWLLRKEAGWLFSYPQIAKEMGRKDHSSAWHLALTFSEHKEREKIARVRWILDQAYSERQERKKDQSPKVESFLESLSVQQPSALAG